MLKNVLYIRRKGIYIMVIIIIIMIMIVMPRDQEILS